MKKMISFLLTLALVTGTSTMAFAEGSDNTATQEASTAQSTKLTPQEQQARDEYLKVHFEDMNKLVDLRQQTRDAVAANNAAAKQIKEKEKGKTELNQDTVTKLKDLASQKKALGEQGKQLQQQRLSLKNQYKDAVKARDTEKMKTIEQQILDINKQVADLKSQNETIKAQISPLKDELSGARASNKTLRQDVKNQLQQVKTIGDTIKSQEQEKSQLWKDYAGEIKNKDYEAAGTTFQKIIEKKSAILDNIKQRGTILNNILASLN